MSKLISNSLKITRILDYCQFQEVHCKKQIDLLRLALNKPEYKFISQECRDTLNTYRGRLQTVKKILNILNVV